MLAQVLDPWRYQWHPEVWVLVAFLTCAYIYMVRVIGPKAVPVGQPAVTRFNIGCFIGAMVMLWVASDWPLHDIGEEYLYSAHMLQHMMLSYFLPPLVLMATPQWLLRVLVGNGKLYRGIAFMCRPVIAAVVFNAVVIITHIPGVVTASVDNGPLHYTLHFAVVIASLLMWMPVVGPFPELQIGPLAQVRLSVHAVAGAHDPCGVADLCRRRRVQTYDIPIRVWGMSVQHDQQLAGAIMKTGGGIFLWTVIVFLFFKRFAGGYHAENDDSYRRGIVMPDAELTGDHDTDTSRPLTTADVERAFAQVPAAPDERSS